MLELHINERYCGRSEKQGHVAKHQVHDVDLVSAREEGCLKVSAEEGRKERCGKEEDVKE